MLFSSWLIIWISCWNVPDIIIATKSTATITNKTPSTIVRGNTDGWSGAASQDITVRSSFAAMYDPSYVTTIRVHDS